MSEDMDSEDYAIEEDIKVLFSSYLDIAIDKLLERSFHVS